MNFWNERIKEDPVHVTVADRLLKDEINGLTPGKVLDFGCGSGKNALELAKNGWSVTGVDWEEEAIDKARSDAWELQLDVEFFLSDLTFWKPSDKYNLVICTYALPGKEGSEDVLKIAMEALDDGGILLVSEWDKSMAENWNIDEEEMFSPERIVDLLSGMTIEKAEVLNIKDTFGKHDPRAKAGRDANVAFVRAKKG